MRLVYLSPVPWESFAQRPHKFVDWFYGRTGSPVMWVDPYPTRFPHWKDLWRSRLSASTSPHTRTPSWLTLLKPCSLPIEPMRGSSLMNGILWRHHLRAINDFVQGGRALLAIGKPSKFSLELLINLRNCSSLYDAMDDFPSFYKGLSHLAMRRTEREVARRVDVILASSSALKSRWMNFHQDVRLVHNALDLSAVQTAVQTVVPARMSIKKKVFGYVGTIATWFDWDWVFAFAAARPEDEIRLIGPLTDQPDQRLPSNIVLLPACGHAEAMKAMTEFHVGLIPFKKNVLTESVDPIKYYEYRAIGLPVISTDFGEMRLRKNEQGVFVSLSKSDIRAISDLAIQFNGNPSEDYAFATINSWEYRFDAANLLS